MRRRIIFSFILAIFLLGSCSPTDLPEEEFEYREKEAERVQITVGRVPAETVIQLLRDNAPFIKLIEEHLDVDVQFKFAPDYGDIIEAMRNEKYDLALLGPLAMVRYEDTVDTPQYRPLVRTVRHGDDQYQSIIFTYRDSGIEDISDLEQESIAFVDRDSASGYLFPLARLKEEGLDPGNNLQEKVFLDRHDRVASAVYNQEAAAGATFDGARSLALEDSDDPDDKLPIIARSRPIISDPLVISKTFEKNHPLLSKQLKDLFTSMHELPDGAAALERQNVDRYIPAKSEEYEDVREVYDTLQLEGPELVP